MAFYEIEKENAPLVLTGPGWTLDASQGATSFTINLYAFLLPSDFQ